MNVVDINNEKQREEIKAKVIEVLEIERCDLQKRFM